MREMIDSRVEDYARAHSEKEPALLADLRRETLKRMRYPQMQIDALEASVLRLLVRLTNARRILEIGTFTGYSALAMAEAMPSSGRLITLDVDPEATALAQRFWKRSPHGEKIELRMGPALASLKTIKGPLDLVFIDADKGNYTAYWNACVRLTRPGGLIVVDNVLWRGRVLTPTDADDRAIVRLNRRARADRRVDVSLLTVRDGILVARKR